MGSNQPPSLKCQSDRLKEAAREHEALWYERLKQVGERQTETGKPGMRLLVAAVALVLAAPVHAQGAQPHKLIVLRGNDGMAITDYPSAARCEAARAAIQRLIARENDGKHVERTPGGGLFIPNLLRLEAYCIPG